VAPEEKQPSYFRNWISVAGAILSVVCYIVIFCLFLVTFFDTGMSAYFGIVTYMLAPGALFFSLFLIPLGAWIERSQRRKLGHPQKFPIIDFNNPVHQRWSYLCLGGITVFIIFSIFGIYRAYNFTESNKFCGTLCHTVMEPEYTAYHQSEHARVKCVECHIGEGAEWFVRSKLSGAYQVYSTIRNIYHRPIETPIRSLRPSQETCERCHWPEKFFGSVERRYDYFLPDEANTEWQTRMLMFIDGGSFSGGFNKGIHAHANPENKIYYVATDEKRQVIPWIRKVGKDGKEEIFVEKGSGYTADKPPRGEMRLMDCMDCHNRPSHYYKDPSTSVNEAMRKGTIDKTLPWIKREAVKALTGKYTTHEDAAQKIRESLEAFYQKKYPEVLAKRREVVEKAVQTVVGIYKVNFFPEMKVSWKEYPNNNTHFIFPGCARCHNGTHESSTGKKVFDECVQCHSIISQGAPGALETRVEGLEYKHPDPGVGEMWKTIRCYDCHTGDVG